jgi:hypothetical protein
MDFGWNTRTGAMFWIARVAGFALVIPMVGKGLRSHAG